jgi:hypothetical protein
VCVCVCVHVYSSPCLQDVVAAAYLCAAHPLPLLLSAAPAYAGRGLDGWRLPAADTVQAMRSGLDMQHMDTWYRVLASCFFFVVVKKKKKLCRWFRWWCW